MASSQVTAQSLVILILPLLILWLRKVFVSKTREPQLDRLMPTVGLGKQVFPWARAVLRSLSSTKDWVFSGYQEYSKFSQPYILPSLDRGPVVIVPPKLVKETYRLPESILDAHATQNETIQTRWTFLDQEVANNSKLHIDVIRNQMTRNLDHLIPVLGAEIAFSLSRNVGASDEWRTLAIWDSCLEIIAGAGNAAFCGQPLCRDDEFLQDVKNHGLSIFAGATIINATPKPLKPLSGGIVRLICYYYSKRATKRCLPLVTERLEQTLQLREKQEKQECEAFNADRPRDALQWIIDECYASSQPSQLAPERIAQRLLILNVISLHSTSFTLQNVLLDLAGTDPSLGVIEALREECRSVLQESASGSDGALWTYEAVKKLRLVDSAIRESMRLTPFANVGLPRTVVDPNGLQFHGPNTISVPKGTVLALPIGPIQRDEAIYPNPHAFDAFRFARGQKVRSSLAVDEGFMGFGFGQHACPGRFFALNEIKLVIAQILLHYDIEHTATRPASLPIMWLNYPAPRATLRVRRRVDHMQE